MFSVALVLTFLKLNYLKGSQRLVDTSPGGQASRRDDCQPSQMSVGCSQMFSGCSRDVLMISQGYSGRSGRSGGPDWSVGLLVLVLGLVSGASDGSFGFGGFGRSGASCRPYGLGGSGGPRKGL